jgi:hypothetical protein
MTNENIPCKFHVGQKVVCVNSAGAKNLVEGHVYTVTWIGNWPARSGLDGAIVMTGLSLAEVEAEGIGFDARRFRPLVTRKTDISVFKAMLKPSKATVPA